MCRAPRPQREVNKCLIDVHFRFHFPHSFMTRHVSRSLSRPFNKLTSYFSVALNSPSLTLHRHSCGLRYRTLQKCLDVVQSLVAVLCLFSEIGYCLGVIFIYPEIASGLTAAAVL
jgi:hypothetical protein